MNITLKSLEYFLVLAEELSFSNAAKKLYISQQCLSETIRRIERDYGVELFTRNHPLSLTYSGRALLEKASKILLLTKSIDNLLKNVNENYQGNLSFGISHGRGRVWCPILLPEFKRLYPLVDINVVMGNLVFREAKLFKGDVDFIVGLDAFSTQEIISVDIAQERNCIIVPEAIIRSVFGDKRNEKMAHMKKYGADITAFADCPFLIMHNHHNMRSVADFLFRKNDIIPHVAMEGYDCEMMFWLSVESLGISFWPETLLANKLLQCSPQVQSKVYVFPLADKETETTLKIGYCRENPPSKIAWEFIERIKYFCAHSVKIDSFRHIEPQEDDRTFYNIPLAQ